MAHTLKYQDKESRDLLDEQASGQIVRALAETDLHARLDMHEQKLGDLLILRDAVGAEGKKTVKDQLRDLMLHRCRRNGRAAV